MYCIDSVIKSKKYFEYLKINRGIINGANFENLRASNQTGFEAIIKLQKSIILKLDRNFDDLDKPASQGFDLSKLEALKEKSNKNFFQDMDKIKTGKNIPYQKNTVLEANILDLGNEHVSVPVSKVPAKSTNNDDLFGLDFGTKPSGIQMADDLLNFGDITSKTKTQQSYKQENVVQPSNNDFLFDLGSSVSTTKTGSDSISFTKPEKSMDLNLMSFTNDLLLEKPSDQKSNQKTDPFNFIVF